MTEQVVVTGGLGRSGRWIVDHLAREGYNVLCVDRSHPGRDITPQENVEFQAVDLTDAGQTFELIAEYDPDAVVHWAAIPDPLNHPGRTVFETNIMAAYNTLVAAGQVGARVVWASSESAYGFSFAEETPLPDSLPITEDHAMRPEDPYGVSKVAGEELAQMVTRRYGISAVAIRPSWIQYPGEYFCLDLDGPPAGDGNFWSYVDVRDVTSMVAAALETEFDDHEAFHAAAADNYLGRPTAEVIEEHFGSLPNQCALDGEQSAISTAKAQTLLEWEPVHSWREAAEEPAESPSLTV